MGSFVAAAGLVVLACAHSVLGERELVGPLLRTEWSIPIPRPAADRIVRFAWHLTSLAWLGLAALALGASPWSVLAAVAGISGFVIFVSLRGHLAWPLFFAVALGAGLAGGGVGPGALTAIAVAAALGLVAVAGLHGAWVLGHASGLLELVVPTDDRGRPRFRPSRGLTSVVTLALLGAATAVVAPVVGWAVPGQGVVTGLVTAVFAARAVGDFRTVGFTKPRHASRFERLDDSVYTPLSVLFAFGGAAALLL